MHPRRPSSPRAPAALFLVFLAFSNARADDPPVPSDPVFKALRADGTAARGRIRQLGSNDRVVLVDGEAEVAIPLDRLVKLTREGDPPASPPEGQVVLFPDGDRLRAQIGNSTETTLELQPPLSAAGQPLPVLEGPLSVPLDGLLAILLAPPSDASAQEALLAKLRDESRKSEVILTVNDDRIAGGFLGLAAQKVSFEREGGPPEIDRGRVAAIEFDPKLVKYPMPEGVWLELSFLDGSRLGASAARLDAGKIVATTRLGATLRAPIASLAGVHVRGPSIAYLSDRKEAVAEYVGYLGSHRKAYGRDRTADGRTIRLGGRPFDRGLGTESRTLLAYRLDPRDRRFQATVGLDDRAGALGSVVFRVLVDGKERFASPAMTARDAPRDVDIDLAGARVLILATEFGDGGDVQDLADWAEARLLRGDE